MKMMRLLAIILLSGLFVGCSVKLARTEGTLNDFPTVAAPAPSLTVRSIDIVAGPVLDHNFIYYRLPNSSARNTYANSRWSAPPPALIAARLKRGLPDTPGSAIVGCHLRLEVDDLIQVFSDAQQSQLTLEGRASLVMAKGLVARRNVNISLPAGADASGAIAVSGELVHRLALDLQGWVAQHCK